MPVTRHASPSWSIEDLEYDTMTGDCLPLETVQDFLDLLATESDLALDLAALDSLDNLETAAAVSAIKNRLLQSRRLILTRAPQSLAHNLYRLGLLEHPLLELRETRKDEAHAG